MLLLIWLTFQPKAEDEEPVMDILGTPKLT